MFYPSSKSEKLDLSLFKNPPSEYRAAPFWAWNCDLKPELLEKEIEYMKEMGFGGFHMHPRVGLATPYLSDDFMSLVKTCVNKAKAEQMRAYLYDEDKWPSGFAGGLNTKDNIEFRQKKLKITSVPYGDGTLTVDDDIKNSTDILPESKYYLLACHDVILDGDGYISSYKRIDVSQKAEGIKLFSYVEYMPPSEWCNGGAYADTMSKPAIENFVKITHERYKECVGEEFGKAVPSIFGDEPQMAKKTYLSSPFDVCSVDMPYTTDFDETFKKAYGFSIIDFIPELVYELPGGRASRARYCFHDHSAERFASGFADTIGDWCREHGIDFTCHMMMEPALWTQTIATGETMRSYRSLGIPGIDMLADHHELSTAKQCQSAARQYGREGMMSELYGVTNWYFDFKGHKQQGDWQAAFGVTFRVPHLFWVSMRGEAKRDYPASIGYQSPWYKEYPYIEDHFARINTVMTRGTPIVNIGVIHPLESFWLTFGPLSQTYLERGELQRKFYEIINWLVFGSQDFDLISESLLTHQFSGTDGGFGVGVQKYKAIIVPNMRTIRSTTLDALEKFVDDGGKVIFMGDVPTLVDALPSDRAKKLIERCKYIDWNKKDLFRLIEPEREVLLANENGEFADNLVYNMRKDGDVRHLFIAHVTEPKDYDVSPIEHYRITIKGEWALTLFDTMTGVTRPLAASYDGKNTSFDWVCGRCDSILLEMKAGKQIEGFEFIDKSYRGEQFLAPYAKYTLSEPNVLLLDMPRYSVGDKLSEPTYILTAGDEIRKKLGVKITKRQPWAAKICDDVRGVAEFYFEINSDIDAKVSLALESIEYSTVYLNGKRADMTRRGYYVDEEAFAVIDLPSISKGKNELKIVLEITDKTQIEAYYLLGDFGVSVTGQNIKLTSLPNVLYFDDVTKQGLPFYGGNITYHFDICGGGNKTLEVRRFTGTAISAELDGARVPGMLAFPPNRLPLGELSDGAHKLDLTLYGNRMNTFGQLHNTILKPSYTDPGMWRPKGRFFTPEYMLRAHGIFTTPVILDE